MRKLKALFTVLIVALAPRTHAESDCEDRLLPSREAKTQQSFIFGSSRYLNLSLLRNYELVEPEVLERFDQEVKQITQASRKAAQRIALDFQAEPNEANRKKLFEVTKILVPIASRHLLARLKSSDELDDYFQTGYLALWSSLPAIAKIPMNKLRSIFYWDGVANVLRKRIFVAMRAQFRVGYAMTPVSLPKTSNFTFEEEILLFGFTPEDRAKIAESYDRFPEEAEAEFKKQEESIAHNLEVREALDPLSVEEMFDQDLNQTQMSEILRRNLTHLYPRSERMIRYRFFESQTYEEIGLNLGLNKERVRQLEASAFVRLRHPARARALYPFSAIMQESRPFFGTLGPRAKVRRPSDFDPEALNGLFEREMRSREEGLKSFDTQFGALNDVTAEIYKVARAVQIDPRLYDEQAKNYFAKVKSRRSRFLEFVKYWYKNSQHSIYEIEADLMIDRKQQLDEMNLVLRDGQKRLKNLKETLNRVLESLEGDESALQHLEDEILSLSENLEALKSAQDNGNHSPELEADRANVARNLKNRRAEREDLLKRRTRAVVPTFQTMGIIFAQEGPAADKVTDLR